MAGLHCREGPGGGGGGVSAALLAVRGGWGLGGTPGVRVPPFWQVCWSW
jgi:hypothetical protein